jgi:hypothetical protein
MRAQGNWVGEEEQRRQRPRKKSGLAPRGAPQRENPKAAWLVRRCPRRQGQVCLPLKLRGTRAEDPCGEGATRQSGCVSQSSLRSCGIRTDATRWTKVRIEPFSLQALPDPKLAWERECRERRQFARALDPRDQHYADQLGGGSPQRSTEGYSSAVFTTLPLSLPNGTL